MTDVIMSTSNQSTIKYFLIKKPRISEKATALAKLRQYVFVVGKDADKLSVKRAIQGLYDGVKITRVNMIKSHPKSRRFGKTQGKTKAYKKTIVTLHKDSKLLE